MKLSKLWKREKKLIPRDALETDVITPGLCVCRECGWSFLYCGRDQWYGAMWPKGKHWETTYDNLQEWAGYPRNMTTEYLAFHYPDCFGRLVWVEPILQRSWTILRK